MRRFSGRQVALILGHAVFRQRLGSPGVTSPAVPAPVQQGVLLYALLPIILFRDPYLLISRTLVSISLSFKQENTEA